MKYQNNPELSELDNFYIANYLEYLNDYITIECFAEHKELEIGLAKFIVALGRILHEKYAINKQ